MDEVKGVSSKNHPNQSFKNFFCEIKFLQKIFFTKKNQFNKILYNKIQQLCTLKAVESSNAIPKKHVIWWYYSRKS